MHPLLKKQSKKFLFHDESVAQQVEHIPFKDGVLGSSPSWFTEKRVSALFFVFLFHPFNGALTILRCKITTKNPNVQIKFILFCHLQDFANVISGET